MNRSCFWIALLALFGALLLAACNLPTPTPAPQPVSIIVVTATFTSTLTSTPAISPTPTPLPREKIEPVARVEGWYWVYGRGPNAPDTDFLYRLRFRSDEWEMVAGPFFRHRTIPTCYLGFYTLGRGLAPGEIYPPPGRRMLVVPGDMATTFAMRGMEPFVNYGPGEPYMEGYGETHTVEFQTQADQCQSAGQSLLDTLQLAPPSPGFVPTPTPFPFMYLKLDDRDPAWSIYSARLFVGGRRANFYLCTDDWQVDERATWWIMHTAIPNCWFGVVEAGNANWGSESQLLSPQPAPDPALAQERMALLVRFWGATPEQREQCVAAAQRVADTATVQN